MYMLDTNICIYTIKKQPFKVYEKFRELGPEDLYISTIVLSELEYGIQKSSNPDRNKTALELFLSPVNILDFDDKAAEVYGYIRRHLEKEGTPIGSFDMLIAAHAIASKKILVTNNMREYERVPDIKLENWV
jgi:tRNA(fMet)-specific endonuclease VapC